MKTIILLSGKRFSGKTQTSFIMKKYFERLGLTVKIMSFSYHLKKDFCEKNNLDLDKFINLQHYKDSYRDELTAYLDTTEPSLFTFKTFDKISKCDEDIFIIDDLRCKETQIDIIKNNFENKYKVMYFRINASDEVRQLRGWSRTSYDSHYCETSLDSFEFDFTILNNFSVEDLEEKIKNILYLNY